LREFGKHFRKIVSQMVNSIPLDHSGVNTFAYKVLTRLILKGESNMKQYLKELDLFPAHEVFEPFEQALKQLRKETNLLKEIDAFTKKDSLSGLAQITNWIKEQKTELIQELRKDPKKQKLIAKLTSKLIHVCTGQYD